MSAVPKYTGPFGKAQAERLLWRAGFGPRPGEAEKLTKLGLKHAVRSLTRPVPYQLVGPDPKDERNRPLAPTDAIGHDHLSWLDRMVRTTAPMIERMTLIWHDWFATSNQGVGSQRLLLDQIDFFRGNALGSFKDILLGVTKDPAMLVWLNGNLNVRQRPNENYARELMELFTLGANRGAYSETDVREQARALTGWRGNVVNRQANPFFYDPNRHDNGTKAIFGKSGNFGWEDACQLCLDHPLHPSFFVSKLWSYFVPTKIDAATSKALEEVYAGRLVRPVVEAILLHPQFYSGPRMTKPPVVFNAGLLRMRGRYIDTSSWWTLGQQAGQQLFYPPDVGGWDDTRWLDTATFRARWFIGALVEGGASAPSDSPSDPPVLVERALQFWGSPTLTSTTQGLLAAFAAAQLKRKIAPGTVETALRRLIASSPDLQTA
ncbi:MAG TPA: DUF1800 domain-containing protein [Gaiellaceae bacterium]|jgi:uncharacterized protein (DUF1800 family)